MDKPCIYGLSGDVKPSLISGQVCENFAHTDRDAKVAYMFKTDDKGNCVRGDKSMFNKAKCPDQDVAMRRISDHFTANRSRNGGTRKRKSQRNKGKSHHKKSRHATKRKSMRRAKTRKNKSRRSRRGRR